jgi:threonine dehydrogenase-like Zn-dependent dehydrogenase
MGMSEVIGDKRPATMPALVWTRPREMVLRAEPTPHLQPGDALVEVAAVGICGSELSGYLGHNALRVPPLIMGHELAGRIVAVAGGGLEPGTPVVVNPLISCGECDLCRAGRANLCRRRQLLGAHRPGAFAQYVAVPARQCLPLPPHVDPVTAALTEPLACALRAVNFARDAADDGLLILGAGAIGLFCLAVARRQGIPALCISDVAANRLAVAGAWGANWTIDARSEEVPAAVRKIFPGGVRAIVDAVGSSATRAQAMQCVRPGGRIVYIGLHDEESPLAANYLVRQEITLQGTFAYTPEDFAAALELLAGGLVTPDPSWLEERPLAAGGTAFAELVAGTAQVAKIVLRPG